jgi:hypothetical protein
MSCSKATGVLAGRTEPQQPCEPLGLGHWLGPWDDGQIWYLDYWIRTLPAPDYQILTPPDPPRVGGWLLILCLLLMVWQPLTVGLTASGALGSIYLGGWPVTLVLILRLIVAGLGIAAGLALLNRRAGAVTLARIVLIVSAATDAFVYLTPYFPSNRAPGETPIVVTVSLLYYAVWILYLSNSRRVRRTFAAT